MLTSVGAAMFCWHFADFGMDWVSLAMRGKNAHDIHRVVDTRPVRFVRRDWQMSNGDPVRQTFLLKGNEIVTQDFRYAFAKSFQPKLEQYNNLPHLPPPAQDIELPLRFVQQTACELPQGYQRVGDFVSSGLRYPNFRYALRRHWFSLAFSGTLIGMGLAYQHRQMLFSKLPWGEKSPSS